MQEDNIISSERESVFGLIKKIAKTPYEYSFDSILKLLKSLLKKDFDEVVTIKHIPSLTNTINEVSNIAIDKDNKIVLYTNRFGVISQQSNIPNEFIESSIFNFYSFNNNQEVVNFFNIFNNRLLKKSFYISKNNNLAFESSDFTETYWGNFFKNLNCIDISDYDNFDFFYTRLFIQKTKSHINIINSLKFLFGDYNFKIDENIGGWKIVNDVTALGKENSTLSQKFYLGAKVWDQSKFIKVNVIGLNFNDVLFFKENILKKIIKFLKSYINEPINYLVQVHYDKQTISSKLLGVDKIALGINSFLHTNIIERYQNKFILKS